MEPRKDLPLEKAALTPRVGVGSDQPPYCKTPPYDETTHMASTKKVVTQPAEKPSDQTPSAAFQPKTRPLGILHSGDF